MKLPQKHPYEKVFLLVMFFLTGCFCIGFVRDFSGDQAYVFFNKASNYMADYFNVATYSSGLDPYRYGALDMKGAEHAYPPLTYVLFYILSRCADYSTFQITNSQYTDMVLLTSSFFMFALSALFYLCLYDSFTGTKGYRFFLSSALILSGIFLFTYERGNIIILAAVCMLFFVMNYKSENKVVRELAFIALAVAAALKAYPALLGILLLFDKRYKEALRLALYGILFTFLPFVFLKGGLYNIPIWIHNLELNTNSYQYKVFDRFNFRYWASRLSDLSLRKSIYDVFGKIDIVLSLIAVSCSFFHREYWKKIMQLLLVIVILPVNSAKYAGIYLFIGMVLFFNEKEHKITDWVYLVLFLLILNPFQIVIHSVSSGVLNVTNIYMNIAASAMLVFLTIESVLLMAKHRVFTIDRFRKI